MHYQFFKSFPRFFGLRFQCSGISCFVSYYWHLKSGTRNPIARFQHNYKARNLSNNSLNFKILVQTKSDTIQISATDLQFVPFINIILQKQNIKMVQTRWSITGVIRTSSDLTYRRFLRWMILSPSGLISQKSSGWKRCSPHPNSFHLYMQIW